MNDAEANAAMFAWGIVFNAVLLLSFALAFGIWGVRWCWRHWRTR